MRKHKLYILLIIVFVCVKLDSLAQSNAQSAIGNYGTVNSYHFNPSWNAYSAYAWQVNVFGLWTNVNNNYLKLNLPYSAYRIPNKIPSHYLSESGNPRFNKFWVEENLNGRNKQVSIASDVFGPSAFVKVKSWRFGLITQGSVGFRVNKLNEALAHAAWMEFDSAKGAYSLFDVFNPKTDKFNVTANSRASIGLNVSKEIKLDWQRTFLIGATFKKVIGFQGFHFKSSPFVAEYIPTDSVLISPASIDLVTYGNSLGSGSGLDIGATYVFHKKDNRRNGVYAKRHTKYFSKIGLSIMDIGSVNYKDAVFRQVNVSPLGSVVDISNNAFGGGANLDGDIDSFLSQFGDYQTRVGQYKVGLPTRFVISSDFQLRKNLFVASIWQQSLRSKASQHARYQNYIMVSPRLEYRYFEVSLPAFLEYDYRSLRLGASFRLGPVIFGTNSLMSFVNTRNVKDADVFIGVCIGNLEAFSFKKMMRKKLKLGAKNKKSNCFNTF